MLEKNKKVLKELERCTQIVRDNGKSVGCLFHNEKELNYFRNIGITFSTNSETARERIIPFDLIPRIFTSKFF